MLFHVNMFLTSSITHIITRICIVLIKSFTELSVGLRFFNLH